MRRALFLKEIEKYVTVHTGYGCLEVTADGILCGGKMDKLKRYIIFIIGLFINSVGIGMAIKADLGTSPLSSIPYILSLQFPFTLGEFTVLFSVFLIVLQLIILKRDFKWEHALQIPVSIVFGYFIDVSMNLLFFVNPQTYVMKVICMLIGCIILGVGVYMEVRANVAMLPGESLVRAIVFRWKTEFGVTKMVFDIAITVIAVLLSVIFFGKLQGIREGTIVAAFLVGFVVRFLSRKLAQPSRS